MIHDGFKVQESRMLMNLEHITDQHYIYRHIAS